MFSLKSVSFTKLGQFWGMLRWSEPYSDAGQFNVFQHALCWIHVERHLRQIVCVIDEQHRLVCVQRQLVWWFYADLKLYKDDPTATRRTALKQRLDQIFT